MNDAMYEEVVKGLATIKGIEPGQAARIIIEVVLAWQSAAKAFGQKESK